MIGRRTHRHTRSSSPGDSPTAVGFGFFVRGGQVKVRIDPKARKRAKDRLRQLTSRRWGVSMERRIEEINRFTVGCTAYYAGRYALAV